MKSIRVTLAIAALVGAFSVTGQARAAIALCVETRTEAAELEGFRKLVLSELGRHPSHHVVEADCQSRLVVELFRASGARYMTVQLDGEVPFRSTIAKDPEVAPRLSEAISQVLGNDPVYLAQDPAKLSTVERASRSVLVRGINTYRLELFEVMARTDHNVAFAPGIGVGFARGADQWQVAARLHLAGSPSGIVGTERALRLSTGMDLSVLWEASRRASTSGYLGTGIGITVMRFAGREDPNDRATTTDVHRWLPVVNMRAGVRFLRIFDFDADAFLQASLPLLSTYQVDAESFSMNGTWTPTLQVGVGVGF